MEISGFRGSGVSGLTGGVGGFRTVAKRVRMMQYHLWKESGVLTTVDLKEATVKGEEWVA